MILKQYYLGCLAHAAYLIADEEAGVAAVVDPQRDVDQYLEDAKRIGCRIEHVFLTHFHADFIAGHLELRDRTQATIYLGSRAVAEYPFTSMRDGEEVRFGRVRLVVLETPGHSPESISILVYDLDKSNDVPHAVLTGDTLFIGDVGRSDLRTASGRSVEQLASMLYDSLHQKLAPLPDETLLYPAHGAGSLWSSASCGRYRFSGCWRWSRRGRSCSTRATPPSSSPRTCVARSTLARRLLRNLVRDRSGPRPSGGADRRAGS